MPSGQLYIFQARPITNLDTGFTPYELMHETDSPHMSEFEIFSRYHWGEILPGACTWMGVFFMTTECLFIVSWSFFGDILKQIFLLNSVSKFSRWAGQRPPTTPTDR